MEDKRSKRPDEVYSKRIRAGKKRTYFIDVKTTKNDDYYLTITESKRDFKHPNYYIKHKIFLYKEDFNKFLTALQETIDHVKTELLPDYEFDLYDKMEDFNGEVDFGSEDFELEEDKSKEEPKQ
ncbi:MAG: DUF3276 family protein [Bacteroidetes bacterium]|jgi:hypothetical protein|nr:DUF3276 family protein [Bacteroidota bacterium]MBT5529410.1 DUF3276 family protein [Cytophagia bacterium]MBT3799772.1 DUF3276 family protein [Bacteroidota bacterium]MBT3935322.1 DUF3276 family protein [Bacteroidota bacterium]MBT6834492.1 DUF3276 family protein [Bacteroidota bacterium]